MDFKGITRDALFMMADNRFRNSKAYYDEHKEELKAKMTVPMRQIAGILGEELLSLDPMMNTIPTKMVSRIRRDTRYTKDRHLYRENMWAMFMRDKHQWRGYPCMWFEVTPSSYSYGIGFFDNEPGLMAEFRKFLREESEEFIQAAISCEKTGARLSGQQYKRPQPDCPLGLEEYYNCKDFYFINFSGELNDLESDKIIGILRDAYKAFAPMYRFLLKVSDSYYSKED